MSSTRSQLVVGVVLVVLLLLAVPCVAQGPGSCGIHLDVLADRTSTHAAIADAPYAPGNGFLGYPPGAPGNPYQAYASPGTTLSLRLTVPAGTLGPAPLGAGSLVTIFYSIGTPFIPLPVGLPGILPACMPGQPLLLVVGPPAWGTIVDGVGFLAVPPPVPPADPGHPYELQVDVLYPGAGVAAPVQLQAVLVTPTGLIGVSNGVCILPGPNPAELSLLPALIPCGPFIPLDEGFAPVPTPPGFTFYGLPQPGAQVNTNPFVEFAPFGVPAGGCDVTGTPGDLGCPPLTATASPRVAVNHYDADWSLPTPFPRVTDITFEIAPPIGNLPTRHIIRWKWGAPFGAPPPFPDTDYASAVCELWGDDSNTVPVSPPHDPAGGPLVDARGRIVVVRQEIHALNTLAVHGMLGIGPGPMAMGFPCTPVPFWTLNGWPSLVTVPFEAVFMEFGSFAPTWGTESNTQTNLALVFDPAVIAPVPGIYVVQDY